MRPCQARPEEPRAVRGAQPGAGSVFRRKPFRFLPPRGSGGRLRIGESGGVPGLGPRNPDVYGCLGRYAGADGLGLRCIAALLGVGIDGADRGDLVLGEEVDAVLALRLVGPEERPLDAAEGNVQGCGAQMPTLTPTMPTSASRLNFSA